MKGLRTLFMFVVVIQLSLSYPALSVPSIAPVPSDQSAASLEDAIQLATVYCQQNSSLSYVTCNQSQPVALNLSNSQFQGQSLPGSISALSALTSLDVSNASLGGSLPSELGQVKNLVALNLNQNWNVSGTIPSSLSSLTALQDLDLSSMQLSGSFPEWLNGLRNLTSLSLAANLLEGSLSPTLGRLQKLQVLDLRNATGLNGTIPASLGMLRALSFLRISNAPDFAGGVPSSFSRLRNLQHLELSDLPGFSGSLTPLTYGTLTKLSVLIVRVTSVHGSLPLSFCKMTNLVYVDLKSNNLSGPIPSSLQSLSLLQVFSLQQNRFSGQIPESLGKLQGLRSLQLGGNKLVGNLPPNFSYGLTSLTKLDVSSNYLTGTIPGVWFLNNTNSSTLNFADNFFLGSINESLCQIPQFNANGNCIANGSSCRVTGRPKAQCQQFCLPELNDTSSGGNLTSASLNGTSTAPCGGYGICTPTSNTNLSYVPFVCSNCQPGTAPDSWKNPPNQTCVVIGPAPAAAAPSPALAAVPPLAVTPTPVAATPTLASPAAPAVASPAAPKAETPAVPTAATPGAPLAANPAAPTATNLPAPEALLPASAPAPASSPDNAESYIPTSTISTKLALGLTIGCSVALALIGGVGLLLLLCSKNKQEVSAEDLGLIHNEQPTILTEAPEQHFERQQFDVSGRNLGPTDNPDEISEKNE